MRIVRAGLGAISGLIVIGFLGCGSNDKGGPSENAGSSCSTPADCYPNVQDKSTISGGAIVCLSQVPGGYCTHNCADDSDCCKADGECLSGHPQVCAPFESTGQKYCFLSCEQKDWQGVTADANTYCHQFANTGLNCRSTGGGVQNRQVCAGS